MRRATKRDKKSSNILVVQDLAEAAQSAPLTEAQRYSQQEALRLENQTKIFASMCPDEVLDYYDSYETRSYHATLMLGDVSGFTDLTEKYTKSGKGGPSKLTETLNSYIGAMVQEILSHGGDVVKFSGDAFIVMWKLESGRVMRDIASEAIKTACVIQKHFGTYDTEVDVTLKVKLAIASGKTYFSPIGDPNLASYYIITGKPVWEVKFAERLCRGGDILVTPSCWQWINPNDYIYEVLPDGVHTLIISLSVLWEDAKDLYTDDKADLSSSSTSSGINSNYASGDDTDTTSTTNSALSTTSRMYRRPTASDDEASEEVTDYSLRPKVIKAARAKLSGELRSFTVRPVHRSVEMDEPLEYLTEIRQVVIVFVNVVTEDTNRKTLVKLVNATFLFVCSIVSEMQGCVNKTSLFDKDLMFLCVFGLRGDKHELESQIGLRCASKLRRGLVKFQHIRSVAVGVTTGMTYCGVVGHVLRREYTVIGMAVNKAARLMCAYVNKVVCDRESFLLSHLEAKHFVLQEAKYLKGITNVGPIYEFSEQSTYYDHDLLVSKYPLLGRDAELRLFREMLRRILGDEGDGGEEQQDETNVLIVRGEPRMGKTRLFEEMSNVAPSHLPVNFISLAPYDKQIPYILLRLLFYTPLDITDDSAALEKQAKLSALFPERDLASLCALNHVFNVDYRLDAGYAAMDERARRRLLKRLIGQMTRGCFTGRPWLVVVDDAELADEESLALFNCVTKQRNALFVMGYGNKLSVNYDVPRKIFDGAQKIDIPRLDKWYHAGVACQVLEVVAIPADLEKVIQEKSSGNPGWIESYLISLLQSAWISLKSMTRKQIHDMGLVTPPVDMLQRSPNSSDGRAAAKGDRHNRWEMYQTSFQETAENGTPNKELIDTVTHFKVCTLTDNFVVENNVETTMDTILLRLYDSLTPLDQFLLKCASVLGEIIDRKMLEKLLHGTSQRDIGLSLVKLFELRIIGCAVGDFNRSAGPAMLFKRVHDSNLNLPIRCGCKGIDVPETLADLPVYAACGLMRFKLTMFRETTYSLLTENQKVEFHSKALLYLRQNTRRCASCGGGQFARLLGESTLNEIGKRRLTEALQAGGNEPRHSIGSDDEDLVAFLNSANMQKKMEERRSHSLPLLRLCKPVEKSPTRTFSDADFTDCECDMLLLTAYTHIIQHCRGIGVSELILVAILEFTEVCLSTLNIPQATKLLGEGEKLIDLIYIPPEDELVVLPYLKGKIRTLRGRCYLESGLIAEAMRCFDATLEIMGYRFPANPLLIRLKTTRLLRQLELMLTCMRRFKVGALRGDAANYSDQFANCLAHMFVVYRLRGMQKHARLAAVWGLKVALESSKDFFVLCTSYANMLITAHNYQYKTLIQYLEADAINLCDRRQDSIELQELHAVAELYTRIFLSRWLRGTIESATRIGFVAARLAGAIRSTGLKLTILPRIVQLLMSECRHGEAVAMLQELEFVSINDMDESVRTWYYALCVDLLLESGISLATRRECEQFYQRESGRIAHLRDGEARDRFVTCMWLWYVRIGDWEAATVWRSRMSNVYALMDKYTVVVAVTMLKKLEGLIIFYVYKLNCRNAAAARRILVHIKETFGVIDNLQRVVQIVYPRYLLIKAYYQMARHRTRSGMSLLQKSKKLSSEIGNVTLYNWADHCEKAWAGTLSQIQQDFWLEQCTMEKKVDWHEVDLHDRKILPYTLKLPNDNH